MAAGEWHPFVGPADVLIPDDTRELIYSGLSSLVLGGAAYVAHHHTVTKVIRSGQEAHVVARVLAAHPKSIYPKAAIRAAVGRTVTRGGWMKGAALVGAAIPGVGLLFTALSIAYSIPPDVRGPSGLTGYQEYQAEMASKYYMPQ